MKKNKILTFFSLFMLILILSTFKDLYGIGYGVVEKISIQQIFYTLPLRLIFSCILSIILVKIILK